MQGQAEVAEHSRTDQPESEQYAVKVASIAQQSKPCPMNKYCNETTPKRTKTIQFMLSRNDDGNDDDPASEQYVSEVGKDRSKEQSLPDEQRQCNQIAKMCLGQRSV